MNLLDKKLGLLVIVALTFFACEDQIGEISLPPENNLGIFFVETSLADKVSQVWAGSSRSSFSGQIMAGHYTDPIFGDINATAYCDISILQADPHDTLTISSAILQSLELSLRITGASGVYSNTDFQTLELYQLAETVQNEDDLTSASSIALGDKIGEAQFILYKDSINLTIAASSGVDSSRFDSNGIYNYTVTFTLTDAYKNQFIENYIQAVLEGAPTVKDSTDKISFFLDEYIKGLAIKPKTDGNAVITFGLSDVTSNLVLEYSVTNQSGQTNLSKTRLILNSFRSFSNIEPNETTPWSNSIFDDVVDVDNLFNSQDEYVYFQSGTNMFINCDLSDFQNFADTLGNVIFQKAELIIRNSENAPSNIANASSFIVFISSLDSIKNGSYNNSIVNIVEQERELAALITKENNLFSTPIPLSLKEISDKSTPFNQIIIGSNPLSSDYNLSQLKVKKEDIILRYYYSTPDKN